MIEEESYQLLLNRVLNYKIQELMQEPYDGDYEMNNWEDDFFTHENQTNHN